MVETHNVEFADDDIDGQKIVFFDGKYHEIGTLGLPKSMPRHPQAPKIYVLGSQNSRKLELVVKNAP